MSEAQNAQILAHLKSGKKITAFEALAEYNCLRLSGRIYDLRQEGHSISMEMVKMPSGKRVGEYWLDA